MAYWDEHGPWGNDTRSEWTDYDGDGRAVRHDDAENSLTWYYVNSSVTGQRITDIAIDGSFVANHIYMGGTKVAENWGSEFGFIANDPVSSSTATMIADGTTEPHNPNFTNETAGLGMSVPLVPLQTYPPLDNYIEGGFVGNAESGCRIDGMEFGPAMCDSMSPFTVPCPNNNCGPRRYRDPNTGEEGWTFPFGSYGNQTGYRVPTNEKTCVMIDGKRECSTNSGTKILPFGGGMSAEFDGIGGDERYQGDDCAAALARAGLQGAAAARALQNVRENIIKNPLMENGSLTINDVLVDPDGARRSVQVQASLLASMALVESSGGLRMQQTQGRSIRRGGAVGWLQIDDPSVSVDDAMNLEFSLMWTVNNLGTELPRVASRVNYDLSDPVKNQAIGLLIHNSGGTSGDFPAVRTYLRSGNLNDLDARTTDHYITKVLAIRGACF